MRILVTGSSGQLGQAIMNSSHDLDHEIVFTARTIVPSPSCYSSRHQLLQLDVTDSEAVSELVREQDIEVVINCAGYTDVARAETEPEKAYLLNEHAAANLARAAKENDAVLIHISTDYIFDGQSSVPYREEDHAEPLGEYGRSKLAGENAVIASGCRYFILRTAWLFSRFGRNFLKTILKKSSEQSMLNVVADQIGTPTYAPDLVDAIFTIIDEGMLDRTGIYNFTNEGVCSWYDFAKEICEVSGSLCTVMPCSTDDYPTNVSRPHYSVLDKRKFKDTFGMEISHWKDSVTFCVTEIEKFG